MVEADVEAEVEDDGLRWYVVAVFVTALVVGFAVAVWFGVNWAADCPSSGGEDPNVARDSLRAELCGGSTGIAVLATIPIGWLAGALLAAVALVRWGGGVRGTLLLVLVCLTPSVLPAATYAVLSRSSTSCSDDELVAYREWIDAGAKGQPPFECRTS